MDTFLGDSFSTMKTNVGNLISDTSSTTATIIGVHLNRGYEDIWQRMLWPYVIDENYTFESVANQAEYDLPSDFDQEVFVTNIATGKDLKKKFIGPWWEERHGAYSEDSISSGTPKGYIILPEVINSTGDALGKIRLDPPPQVAETYAMPYKRRFVKLLGTTGTCTTNTASKIIASASTFLTDGVQAGMRIHNTTDNTFGYVSSVDSETQITASWDMCPDGNESFTISNYPLIPRIEKMLEYYATAHLLARDKQFEESTWWLNLYENEVRKRVIAERQNANATYQRISEGYRVSVPRPFSGETSYDTI